jgi:glycosyltransferase involved in cell wall biosynthesis
LTQNRSHLVSVIVPAHNAASYIGSALDSVLAQTYAELEVVVVDDGSADETPAIVAGYAARDGRVTLHRQSNLGVAAARNAAIERARGTYVAPLDADDVWRPDKLAKQVRRMEEGHGSDLVYCWWQVIDEDDVPLADSHPWRVEGDVADALVGINFVGNASVPLIRRSSLDAAGGYDTMFLALNGQGCEDWDLSLRVAERGEVRVVPEYLVGYRHLRGSMSGDSATMIRSHELMLAKLVQRRPDVPSELLRWSRGQIYGYVAQTAARSGAYVSTVLLLLRALSSRDVSLLSPGACEVLLRRAPRIVAAALAAVLRRSGRSEVLSP